MVVVDPKTEIRSARLLLRPLRMEDAPDIHLARSNPEVMRYGSAPPAIDIKPSEEWLQSCLDRPNCYKFAIELLEPNADGPRCVGTVGAARTPEIGYGLHNSCWGKGYATEALQAFMRHFWQHFSGEERYDYAIAYCDPKNIGSRKVLEKNGFELEKIAEKHFDNPFLGTKEACYYRISRPEEE